MPRPPFDLLRACFLLVAVVVLIMMLETLLAAMGCIWLVAIQHAEPLGSCAALGGEIREIMSELLTAILALIASSRGGRPPDDRSGEAPPKSDP